jgi:hypothetical protein
MNFETFQRRVRAVYAETGAPPDSMWMVKAERDELVREFVQQMRLVLKGAVSLEEVLNSNNRVIVTGVMVGICDVIH